MKRSHSVSSLVLGLSAATALSYGAQAQVLPNTARPDTLERQYNIQDQRPVVGGAPLVTMPKQPTKKIAGAATFVLHEIKLENATAFSTEELRDLYKDKLNTKISLDDLNKIADDITSYYRNHGYILTRAILPPQKATDGVVTIRIVEGFVSNIKLQGDKAEDAQIRAYADKITSSKPLNSESLERYLLLMNDLPGVQARAVLQPSADTPGASDIVITVTRKPFEAAVSLDNRGTRYLGPVQASATLYANNLLGFDDQTQLRGVNTIFNPDELQYVELRHEEQLGNEGTKIVVSASHVETRPGYNLDVFDIDGTSDAFSIGVSHPLLRSRQSNWFVNTDFTVRNVDVDALSQNLYYDKTRVLTLGTSYDFLDSTSAINRLEFSAAHGFNLGTDVDNQPRSRGNGDPSFQKFNAKVSRIQPIVGSWSAYAALAGQYSFQPLLASEEFALGGPEFGSAFDPAELTGDSGLAGRVELQYNQNRDSAYLSQYQLYGFFDSGEVWNRSPIPGSEASSASLSSTGLGARFNLLESVTGSVEGALPVGQKVAAYGADGGDPRVFFSLQYRY